MFGIWDGVFCILDGIFGIGDCVFGIWDGAFGIWDGAFGIWDIVFGVWELIIQNLWCWQIIRSIPTSWSPHRRTWFMYKLISMSLSRPSFCMTSSIPFEK